MSLPPRLPLLASLFFALLLPATLPAAADDTSVQRPQFIYLLRLVERLHTDRGWTKADEEIVARHFRHLKAATETGQAIVVGRTREPGDRTFGLVIFEANDLAAAEAFAQSDPAVVAGVMTVEVRPFSLVLLGKM
ncbi:MAG TPA: YciI family protein [Lacunisphaera sp.]|nr:YciI family protein [Lacunisphaera sp.]